MARRLLFWVLIVAFIWLVIARLAEIQHLMDTLLQGQWQWVLVAAALQVVYYLAYTEQYRSAFRTVDLERSLSDLLPLTFASIFVNVAAPTAGASGAALYVDDAKRRGESGARAAVGTLLTLIADFSAFFLVLILGLVYLFMQHNLEPYEILGALILFFMTLALSSVLILGVWTPSVLPRLLGWVQATANRLSSIFSKTIWLEEGWAQTRSEEFTEAALAITTRPERLARTLGVALTAHMLDLASLYALFLAFHRPVGLGILVAGYAMGILFWIVSITPQGIGVVEGVMTLVFTSLGVPAERAALISLAFRGLTFWLPLGLGFLTLRRVRSFSGREGRPRAVSIVRLLALLTAGMGVVNLLTAVTPGLDHRIAILNRLAPLVIRRGSHLTVALAGIALLFLAVNLWRRKHVAWLATEIVLGVSVIGHLLKGLDFEEAVLAAALAIGLWVARPSFHALSDPPAVRQGIQALGISLLAILVYGSAGFYLLDRHYSVSFSLAASLKQTVVMFIQFYDPGLVPLTGFGRYFAASIYVVGIVSLGHVAWLLTRPVIVRQSATEAERRRATQIVETYGRSSLASLTLLPDKSYYFSPGGSLVAYAVKGRVAVSLGDPIGPEEDTSAAVSGFAEFCRRNDWAPSFYQALPDHLERYQEAGFETLCIGHEAIVSLAEFSLEGREHKGLRSAFNRLTKLQYKTEVLQPPLERALLDTLQSISDEWLTMMHGSEKRFSLGWFEEEYLQSGPVMVVRAPDGDVCAFVNLVSEYQLNELTIDLMRHRAFTEHGVMDFLFVSLFHLALDQGYETFNLGLSALSGVGEEPNDPAVERLLHYIYENVNQFYNFKGLHEYKEKFDPLWSPRYLVYPGVASLAAVWLGIVRANSGESLLGEGLRELVEKIRRPAPPPASPKSAGPGHATENHEA